MNQCFLVTILVKPAAPRLPNDLGPSEVFRFVTTLPEGRAHYLAGAVGDSLADYWGREFDYRVEALPSVDGATPSYEIVRMATDKVSF